jgi:hypothetical protein
MQIGMVGLGKMGGNMSRRPMKAGHHCVVLARYVISREALVNDGAAAAVSLADVVQKLGDMPCGLIDVARRPPLNHHTSACWSRTILSSMAATPSTKTTSVTRKSSPTTRIRYVDCGGRFPSISRQCGLQHSAARRDKMIGRLDRFLARMHVET